MRTILSILMLVATIAGIAFFIVPQYEKISALRVQQADYEEVLTNARKLKEQRNAIVDKYNQITAEQVTQLDTMLPVNPDNVKLVRELDTIARQQGLLLQNIKTENTSETAQSQQPFGAQTNSEIGELTINFTVAGPYTSFTNFIKNLEKNLRIIDIQKISFSATDPKLATYQYTVSVKTYWLK